MLRRGATDPDDGDIVALSPPLIVQKWHIDRIVETLGEAGRAETA